MILTSKNIKNITRKEHKMRSENGIVVSFFKKG